MNKFKTFASEQKNKVVALGSAAVAGASALGSQAMAAVDITGVNTAIGLAETDAQTIGTTVIGVIAGLAVVGIIIGLVRKL